MKNSNGNNITGIYDASVSTLTLIAPVPAASNIQASTRTTSSITWTWTDNAGRTAIAPRLDRDAA